jgi:8-oxo-dGTP pyrophosphatase MutT (NUDIX family)
LILDRLARALLGHEAVLAGRDPPFREAAVALVLTPRGDDAQLLLLRRATHAADPWSGQVGLPGGHIEAHDSSLLHTAIRETREETSVDLASAMLLGTLDELRPRTAALPPIIVRPYVLVVPEPPRLVPSVEVAELFWAPLAALFDPANMLHTEVGVRGMRMAVDAIDFEGRIIWGMTERILRSLQRVLNTDD